MAGSRNFRISTISRKDLMSLTEDAAKITGIPFVMDAYREEAEEILDAWNHYERVDYLSYSNTKQLAAARISLKSA